MGDRTTDGAGDEILVERVRDVRVEVRLPTPPMLEIVFYAGALLSGIALGAVASLLARVVA